MSCFVGALRLATAGSAAKTMLRAARPAAPCRGVLGQGRTAVSTTCSSSTTTTATTRRFLATSASLKESPGVVVSQTAAAKAEHEASLKKEESQQQQDKVLVESCGDIDNDDDDDDDGMEQEEMFVDPHESFEHKTREWGGPRRGGRFPEPTRFGDWERKGRCTDF